MKRILLAGVLVFAFVLLVTGSAFAGTVSRDNITLTYPDYLLHGPALESCEPWNDPSANTVSLTGIPEGATVSAHFYWSVPLSSSLNFWPVVTYENVAGGSLTIPVIYLEDTEQWPVYGTNTGERAIAVGVLVSITTDSGSTKLSAKNWWVRCAAPPPPPPPPPAADGCTPGYWRQAHHYDSWVATGYSPADSFGTVFGVVPSFSPSDLGTAVALNGGGESALARHAVAALLNAAHPDGNYAYTVAEVITGVQNAYATGNFEPFKDDLDIANNAGCSLN